MKKSIKINCIGSFFGQDGYSNHTKQLANALNNLKDIEVAMTCNKPHDWVRWVNDNELKMLQRNPDDCDINLMIAQPIHWPVYLSEDKPFIGFVVFEGDCVPLGWIDILLDERVNQIWVPSEHTKQAIENTWQKYIKSEIYEIKLKDYKISNVKVYPLNKIKIVPHGVSTKLFYPTKK